MAGRLLTLSGQQVAAMRTEKSCEREGGDIVSVVRPKRHNGRTACGASEVMGSAGDRGTWPLVHHTVHVTRRQGERCWDEHLPGRCGEVERRGSVCGELLLMMGTIPGSSQPLNTVRGYMVHIPSTCLGMRISLQRAGRASAGRAKKFTQGVFDHLIADNLSTLLRTLSLTCDAAGGKMGGE